MNGDSLGQSHSTASSLETVAIQKQSETVRITAELQQKCSVAVVKEEKESSERCLGPPVIDARMGFDKTDRDNWKVCRDGDLSMSPSIDTAHMNSIHTALADKCIAEHWLIPLRCIDTETYGALTGPAIPSFCQLQSNEIRDSRRSGFRVIDPVICTTDPDGAVDTNELLRRLRQGDETVALVKGRQRVTMAQMLGWESIQVRVYTRCGTLDDVLGLRAMWHSTVRTATVKRDSPFVLRIIRPLVEMAAKDKGRQIGVADIDAFPAPDQMYTESRTVMLESGKELSIRPIDRGERAVIRTKLAAFFPRELRLLIKPLRELNDEEHTDHRYIVDELTRWVSFMCFADAQKSAMYRMLDRLDNEEIGFGAIGPAASRVDFLRVSFGRSQMYQMFAMSREKREVLRVPELAMRLAIACDPNTTQLEEILNPDPTTNALFRAFVKDHGVSSKRKEPASPTGPSGQNVTVEGSAAGPSSKRTRTKQVIMPHSSATKTVTLSELRRLALGWATQWDIFAGWIMDTIRNRFGFVRMPRNKVVVLVRIVDAAEREGMVFGIVYGAYKASTLAYSYPEIVEYVKVRLQELAPLNEEYYHRTPARNWNIVVVQDKVVNIVSELQAQFGDLGNSIL